MMISRYCTVFDGTYRDLYLSNVNQTFDQRFRTLPGNVQRDGAHGGGQVGTLLVVVSDRIRTHTHRTPLLPAIAIGRLSHYESCQTPRRLSAESPLEPHFLQMWM